MPVCVIGTGLKGNTFAMTVPQGGNIVREVRHELATLPYYGVFDWLEFEVQPDNTVILRGKVVRPTTKSDAEARVKKNRRRYESGQPD